jgi:phospholipid-binding lipoprotein MlaA
MIVLRSVYVIISLLTIMLANNVHALEQNDPLEGLNRGIYYFNKLTDSLYIKPATTAYEKVIPYPARISVSNWFNNIAEVPTIINGVLQGKIIQALSDTLRLGINSTLGMFGFFDIATQLSITSHKEDLGKTFYTWGWKNSSYFVIPIIGPSTIRDAVGVTGNLFFMVPTYFKPVWRNSVYVLGLINRRQDLHEIESIVGVAGVEYYNLVRSSYFQHREYELTNGAVVMPGDPTPGDDLLGEPPD